MSATGTSGFTIRRWTVDGDANDTSPESATSMLPGAQGVSDSHGLKNFVKQHDNGPTVSPKALMSSSEAVGSLKMEMARDCPPGA
ncbi:hypothetical protein EVAR_38032_1 [Eumeta japonica]|uniref:Uncharacterized protein n=1 Tax=Eumeta variegata TaxID=151549 RepID=A0A4C1W7C8_EUMVA|nr:hypothetical protein EVAR_38032_1 [Eumeta japonica]